MAYSRPRNGGVNVQQQENAGNTPSIIGGSPSAKVSAAGPLRDNRDPNQILAAGNQRANEINKFLNFFQEDVRPFVTEELDRRAKREAGEVLDAFESKDLLSGATTEAADAWRSLSPRARDFAIEQAAIQSVASFQPIYAAEIVGGPDKALLARPSANNPELQAQQAEARGRALQVAQERSGLANLPPFQRLQYTGQIAQAQSAVDSGIYKQRIASQAQADEAAISGGLAVDLTSAVTTEQASEGVAALSAAFTKFQENALNQLTSDRAVAVLYQGLQKTFANIKNPDEKLDALRRIQDQTKFPLEMNGINLWDAPIGNSGKTMTTVLDDLYEGFEDEKLKDDRKAVLQKIAEAANFDEQRAIIQNYITVSDDPEFLPTLLQYVETDRRFDTLAAQENDLQAQVEFLRIYDEQGPEAADNYLKEQIRLGVVSDTPIYSRQWMKDMIRQRQGFLEGQNKLRDPDGAIFSQKAQQARALNREYIDTRTAALVDQFSGSVDQVTAGALKSELTSTALNDLRKRYNELSPEERKTFDFGTEMQKSVDQAYRDIRNGIKKDGDLDPLSPKRLATVATNLEGTIANSGGVLTVDVMPLEVLNSIRAGGNDPTKMNERQLATALVNFLEMFKEKNAKGEEVNVLTGTPDRKDIEKWLSTRLNKARSNSQGTPTGRPYSGGGGRNQPDRTPASYFAPMGADEILQQQQLYQKELDRIQNENIRENIKTRLDAVSEAITPVLNLVAGAPANAGTLENVSPEAIAALERSWNNRGPASTTDPATPQVAASTPTRRLPARITPNHEWMIAIGIAEGTRTPNGGYTKNWGGHSDPGDKFTNVGTVSYSAGRHGQYLSPQQVDEKYSRQFTQTVLKMTPFLEKLGLKQGTQGFNRVMFNILDLEAQAPTAAKDFIYKLGTLKKSKFSVEAIAKARADSFFNPVTGRLDASGFGNNYQRLLSDQLSRARVFDYKKRF